MEIPKWADYMLPELMILNDEKEHKRKDIFEDASKKMKLTEETKSITINSGDFQWINRAGWALTYLKQSGLVDSPRRGYFIISNDGKELLKTNPKRLIEKDLEKYPKYKDFCKRSIKKSNSSETADNSTFSLTPEDLIDEATNKIRSQVCDELLEKVRSMDPTSFEKIVITLIKALGYGDNNSNSGIHTGKTGDGGIDGVINQDKLGLDTIYIQAKRYKEDNKVSVHDVRDFVGALQGKESKGARKGVFITTSSFTKDGRDYVEGIKDGKVILIDGEQLAELMYDNGVGVSVDRIIRTNKIDEDFFE